jgi:hypothetical protein
MKDFTTTFHCLSRAHCQACRSDAAWRAAMAKSFIMPDDCPHVTGLGDLVAKALKLPGVSGAVEALTGIDPHKPCAGCKKRRALLNKMVPIGKVNANG